MFQPKLLRHYSKHGRLWRVSRKIKSIKYSSLPRRKHGCECGAPWRINQPELCDTFGPKSHYWSASAYVCRLWNMWPKLPCLILSQMSVFTQFKPSAPIRSSWHCGCLFNKSARCCCGTFQPPPFGAVDKTKPRRQCSTLTARPSTHFAHRQPVVIRAGVSTKILGWLKRCLVAKRHPVCIQCDLRHAFRQVLLSLKCLK